LGLGLGLGLGVCLGDSLLLITGCRCTSPVAGAGHTTFFKRVFIKGLTGLGTDQDKTRGSVNRE